MGNYVSHNAILTCSMGLTPSALCVLPNRRVNTESKPKSTIMDHKAYLNVKPFGLCKSPVCPTFIKVSGTPGPCLPALPGPWVPGKTNVLVGNQPALTKSSVLQCVYGGTIRIVYPGELTVLY